jgi:hypothetical protein
MCTLPLRVVPRAFAAKVKGCSEDVVPLIDAAIGIARVSMLWKHTMRLMDAFPPGVLGTGARCDLRRFIVWQAV